MQSTGHRATRGQCCDGHCLANNHQKGALIWASLLQRCSTTNSNNTTRAVQIDSNGKSQIDQRLGSGWNANIGPYSSISWGICKQTLAVKAMFARSMAAVPTEYRTGGLYKAYPVSPGQGARANVA